jgi:hypothetical protein
MSKIIRKRIIIRPGGLSNLSSKIGNDMETAGGTLLDPLRKRQSFSEALRETIEQNRSALRKLARR